MLGATALAQPSLTAAVQSLVEDEPTSAHFPLTSTHVPPPQYIKNVIDF